ncbi:MAG TPA: mannose-6-phosphate isomerase, class I [Ilumatobacter sp.]|nr:mannose-6-phosphate isomerase, class I [Ilumatobacter sp.]
MQRVRGVVQHYAWGDPDFIPRLLGIDPDGRPCAELWLGTHERGPATLDDGRPLVDATGDLPYLLKVLAAQSPLSLQTHPDDARAADGFRRGVFSDPHAKPELLCALTPFHALCGVRPVDATLTLLDELEIRLLSEVVAHEGPAAAFTGLLTGRIDPTPIVRACEREDGSMLEAGWVRLLAEMYPGDPSVAATLLLNLVVLEPGQALRLGAGNVHAYLRGAGIELMGPSDNVVRAGLTAKAVDVDELLRVADLTPLAEPVLPVADRYELPDADIVLRRLEPGDHHTATMHELAIELTGTCWYLAPGDEYAPSAAAYVVTR